MYTINLTPLKELTVNAVNLQIQKLEKLCNEDQTIAEFVHYITYPIVNADEQWTLFQDDTIRIGLELSTLVNSIMSFDIELSTVTTIDNFQANWAYALCEFISIISKPNNMIGTGLSHWGMSTAFYEESSHTTLDELLQIAKNNVAISDNATEFPAVVEV